MERNYKISSKKDNKEKISYKKIIITVILLVIAISSSFIVFFALQIALGTSNPVVVVISGSMEPNIYKGDLLFVQGIKAEDIRNGTVEDQDGDVIVFYARWLRPEDQAVPVVHRVVNKSYEDGVWKFQTKGDNVLTNPFKDEGGFWTSQQDIIGVVVSQIPYIGWVKILLTDEPIITYLIIGIIIILIISLGWDMSKENKLNGNVKKKKQIERYTNYSPNSWENDYVDASDYSPLSPAPTPPRPPRYPVPPRLENPRLKQHSDPPNHLTTQKREFYPPRQDYAPKRQDNIPPSIPRGPTAAPAGHDKYFATRPEVSPIKKLNQVASRGLTAKPNKHMPIPQQHHQTPVNTPHRRSVSLKSRPKKNKNTNQGTNRGLTAKLKNRIHRPQQHHQTPVYTPPRTNLSLKSRLKKKIHANQVQNHVQPRQTYTPQPQPSQNTHPNTGGHINRRKCPRCGASGFDIKEVEDKTRLISYIPSRIYAKKNVCKKCTLDF